MKCSNIFNQRDTKFDGESEGVFQYMIRIKFMTPKVNFVLRVDCGVNY